MADALTTTSRSFYERSKAKIGASIVIGAFSLMLLGFCSTSAGEAAHHNSEMMAEERVSELSQDQKDAHEALVAGYGFGAFVYILGFILLVAAAIYVSPLICGTAQEARMVKTPFELEGGGKGQGQGYNDGRNNREQYNGQENPAAERSM